MQAHPHGFTLMELILTVTITAIILSLATPYLGRFISNQRLVAATRTLQLDAMYARATAVSGSRATVACPSAGGEFCDDSSAWHGGWILFLDNNADRDRQPGEELIRVSSALQGVQATSSRFRKRFRFLPNGTAVGTAMSISMCPQINMGTARKLVIANSGRVRQEVISGGDAVIQCGAHE